MIKKNLTGEPLQYGIQRMRSYAIEHGFTVVEGSYKVVKKHHKKNSMKDIDAYGRVRKECRPEEFCEVMKVRTVRRNGDVVEGFLVGYPDSGIRFDAHAKY